MTLDEFFQGQDESRQLFTALHSLIETMNPCELRVSKSQIAFCRRKPFAWAWMPADICIAKPLPWCSPWSSPTGTPRRAGKISSSRGRGASSITWSCFPLKISMMRCAIGCRQPYMPATRAWPERDKRCNALCKCNASAGSRRMKSFAFMVSSP